MPTCSIAPVAVVLVNWKNASDTLACIESLLAMTVVPSVIAVCDNYSDDGSMARFAAWCEVERFWGAGESRRPVTTVVDKVAGRRSDDIQHTAGAGKSPVVAFLENSINAGFAGGCNAGMSLAQRFVSPEWVWFLNNDTVVDKNALDELMKKAASEPAGYGLIGARVMYFDEPARLQYAGGATANPWLATVAPLDTTDLLDASESEVESRMDYVSGASMLASRAFLEQVGPMSEAYFLYYEELDWAARARGRFRMGYASRAVVFHREGASIGGKTVVRQPKSRTADFYATRSRVLFTARHYRRCLPTVIAAILAGAARRALAGRFSNGRYVIEGLVGGLKAAIAGGRT